MRILKKYSPDTRVLFTGMAPNIQIAKMLAQSNFAGYILKDEIRYSLAWAVSYTNEYKIVVTPGVCSLFEKQNPLPHGTVILDGRNSFASLSPHNTEMARMAFIFSMERHEFADENDFSEDYSYGVISGLFDKIGLNDILAGEGDPKDVFGDHPFVLGHVEQAIKAVREANEKAVEELSLVNNSIRKGQPDQAKMPRISNKETLAFHLLTLPDIDVIS